MSFADGDGQFLGSFHDSSEPVDTTMPVARTVDLGGDLARVLLTRCADVQLAFGNLIDDRWHPERSAAERTRVHRNASI